MERATRRPIVGLKPVVQRGKSYYILLPKDWFTSHNIDLPVPEENKKVELLVVADSDIRIINPKDNEKIYEEITRVVKGI